MPPLVLPERITLLPAQIAVLFAVIIEGTGGAPKLTALVFKLIAPAVVKAFPVRDAPAKKFNAPEAIIVPLNAEPAPSVTAPLT